MFDYFDRLYESTDFMPHGDCLVWEPSLLWQHAGSDIATGIAYYLIAAILFYFIIKRRDIPFFWIFILFGAFILSCGTTHFFAAWTIYYPSYWTEGIMKTINAVVSLGTAIILIPLMPKLLALPSLQNALDEVAQKKAEFEAIFNAITDAVVFVDQKRRVVMINPGFTEMLGYKPEEILGKTTQIIYANPEDFTEQGRVRYSKEAKIKKPIYETKYRHKDGAVFPAETLGAQVVDSKGAVIGFLGIIRDISERKQAEEKLLKEKEKAQIYLDVAGVMICSLNSSGEITLINQKGCQILNVEENQVIGKNWFDHYLPKRLVDDVKEVFQKLMAGNIKAVEYYENPILTSDKEERILAFHNTVLTDNKGNITGVLFAGEDITDRKKAEEEKANLESILRQAYKMDAIGTMAGGIAHDFNNILSIIVGYAELIKRDSSNESNVQQHIKEVQVAADRAKNLVRQILAFSRKEKAELIPIPPQQLIKETLKLLRSTTPTTVSIIQEISQDCGMIMTDPTQLHQLLMNLFVNAVHAMDEKGEVTVTLQEVNLKAEALTHKPELLPGRYACLSVSDTGAGMDQDMINRIFDPFYTTKDVGKGTGMGLSVVHGIVESHRGFIDVESELGRGSTFNVFFPVTEEEEEEIFDIETTHSLEGTERILLVDDETMILEVAEQMLENFGYEVTTENSSVKALEIFKSKPDQFDLLITDQSMPNMSGTELVAEILKAKPGMPIILCSGYSTKVSAENAREIGISKYMTKPYRPNELVKATKEVLNGKV